MKENKNEKTKKEEKTNLVETLVPTRGRTFEGTVTKKFAKRVVIEFERTVYVVKYERFYRKKTRIHARLPEKLISEINVGDYVRAVECRPLSKIIHAMVVMKLRDVRENPEASKLLRKQIEVTAKKEKNKVENKENKK